MQNIHINIWDDYEDDCSETYAYVDGYDECSIDQEVDTPKILTLIYDYIKTLNIPEVTMNINGIDLEFNKLSHQKRLKLIRDLRSAKLKYNDIMLNFYSES